MRWWLRLLIALLLVVGYAFCYFIVPKIAVSWITPGPEGCDLRLMTPVKDVRSIPTAGDSLFIVAVVDHVLHFRVFDGHGKIIVDTDEKKLTEQVRRIEELRKQLESLWPPQKPTRSERVRVIDSVASIVGHTWHVPPRWVIMLSECSHFLTRYAPPTLLVLAAWILVRRWSSARKAKPRWLQFGLGTVLGTVAVFAVTVALLNAWFLAPYQAERQAAAALTRFGGKILMVDHAPRWFRYLVSKDIFRMDVASLADLSHSRVTDSDLVYLLAFRHCGQINLSDTQPSSLNLSGNRVARLEMPRLRWSPLLELNLSDTDADDGTLASLPDGLVNLSDLNLCGTNVSDDGLLSLLRMEGLVKLNLIDTRVTAAGVARLKSRWRYSRPLSILTGTRKKAGGTPKNPSPQGTSGTSAPAASGLRRNPDQTSPGVPAILDLALQRRKRGSRALRASAPLACSEISAKIRRFGRHPVSGRSLAARLHQTRMIVRRPAGRNKPFPGC
jgi:hypothetical protein